LNSYPGRLAPADIGLVLVICIVWAGNLVSGKVGMEHFSPFLFMTLRFIVVLAILLPFLRLPPPGQWGTIIFVGLMIGALHFTFLFWALARSQDVSSVGILLQTYIPLSVLLAMFLMGERVGGLTLAAIFFTFTGVMVVGFDPLVLGQPDVLVITLGAALFQALGSIYQRRITGIGVLNFQAWIALIALPVMAAASLITEQGQIETILAARWPHWAAIGYTAVMASIVGHGLFFFLVQRNPVSMVMPYLQMTPVIAVIFGVLFWGDQPGSRLLLGGAMVIGGILFITLRARRRALKMRSTLSD
jgi:O-acetylserine/cysteine efflux transporter